MQSPSQAPLPLTLQSSRVAEPVPVPVPVPVSPARARARESSRDTPGPLVGRFGWRARSRPNASETARVTRQLATMAQAGIPIVQALELLRQGSMPGAWPSTLQDLADQIMAGSSLAQALTRHPRHFSVLYRQMVAAGELSGNLAGTLEQLAETLDRNERLRSRLRSALLYPVMVLGVAALVVTLLLLWVVPVFEEVFESFGASLPWPTRMIILLSQGLTGMLWPLLLTMGVVALLARSSLLRERWPAWRDRWLLRLPLIGPLLQMSVLARWSQTLASLLSAGLPLAEALGPAGQASGHPAYERASVYLQRHITQGSSLHGAMASHPRFPPMLVQMCATGEETGTLEILLRRAGDWMAGEFETRTQSLTALLEPLIIVILGLAIGGILVAMYLPIFQLGRVF
ncbi:MAG: type II secretion system F family protein [Limnohabitans sp.]|jgi:type IV pilus assembly protein PilC